MLKPRSKHVAILLAPTVILGAVLLATATAASPRPIVVTYSPLTAVATGPSGPASALFTVAPDESPSTALEVDPDQVIGEDDFQWVELGLTTPHHSYVDPGARTRLSVRLVRVCYSIATAAPGSTYISQTRLTDMRTPNTALVVLDDGTNRTAVEPQCYRVPANVTPRGTLTLALKVVFGSADDEIKIGMVSLNYRSP